MEEEINGLKQVGMTTAKTLVDIMSMLEKLKIKPEKSPIITKIASDTPFIFTGQITDLSYFQNAKSMPISAINSLEPELQVAVKDNFEKAAKDGLIKIDNQTGTISITVKGEKYIQNPTFLEHAKIDQSRAFTIEMARLKGQLENAEVYGVELDGTVNDLNYFNHSNELDLNEILQNPNKEVSAKINESFKKLEQDGLVYVTDNKIKLTAAGEKYAHSKDFLNLADNKGLSEKLISKIAASGSKIIAITKAIVGAAETIEKAPSQSTARTL
ncbi:MAG: hypothetical protein RR540_00535 [Oscillospiraceae bacterium]